MKEIARPFVAEWMAQVSKFHSSKDSVENDDSGAGFGEKKIRGESEQAPVAMAHAEASADEHDESLHPDRL